MGRKYSLDYTLPPRVSQDFILDSRPFRPHLQRDCMNDLSMVFISLGREFRNDLNCKQNQKAKQASRKAFVLQRMKENRGRKRISHATSVL